MSIYNINQSLFCCQLELILLCLLTMAALLSTWQHLWMMTTLTWSGESTNQSRVLRISTNHNTALQDACHSLNTDQATLTRDEQEEEEGAEDSENREVCQHQQSSVNTTVKWR